MEQELSGVLEENEFVYKETSYNYENLVILAYQVSVAKNETNETITELEQ